MEEASKGVASGDPSRHHLSRLARGGALNFVGIVASAVFGFGLLLVVTRGFDTGQVGAFFESVALFSLAMSVALWGADIGVIRSIPRLRVLGRDTDIRSVVSIAVWTVVAGATVMAALLFVLASPLSVLLAGDAEGGVLRSVLRALAPFLPLAAALTVLLAVTRGLGTMVPTNLVDRIGRAGTQPLFALAAALAGWGSVALGVGWAIPYGLGCVVALVWVRSLIRSVSPGASAVPTGARGALFREFWRFTAPRGLAGVFAVTIIWLDTLMIGALRSTAEAGVYAAATRYLVFGAFASQAVMQAIGPALSELLTGERRETARVVYRAGTAWAMLVGWPIYLMLVVFAPAFLSILGSGYGDALGAVTILAATMLVASACGPVDLVLLMSGKSAWNLFNTLVAVALNVGLNLLLIPRLGLTGAAIAWSASILANNLLPLLQVRGLVRIDPFGREPVLVALIAVACFGGLPVAIRALLGPTVGALAGAGIAGAGLYAALLWWRRREIGLDRLLESLLPGHVDPAAPGAPTGIEA